MPTEQPKRENCLLVLPWCLLTSINEHFAIIKIALPFIANFAAGAIAGVSEILTFYPLGECHASPVLAKHNLNRVRPLPDVVRSLLLCVTDPIFNTEHMIAGQDAYAIRDWQSQAWHGRHSHFHHPRGRVSFTWIYLDQD